MRNADGAGNVCGQYCAWRTASAGISLDRADDRTSGSGSKAGVVVHQPESLKMNGRRPASMTLPMGGRYDADDPVRHRGPALCGGLLLNAGTGAPTAEEAYGVQKSFAEALRW